MRRALKRKIIYLIALLIAFIGGLYVYLAFSNKPNKFWRNFANARVSIDGHPVSNVYVYKHPDGSLLIELSNNDWVIYWQHLNNIGLCISVDYIPIPGYIFAYHWNDEQQPCVSMGDIKIETRADLIARPNYIEFTAPIFNSFPQQTERVRIGW